MMWWEEWIHGRRERKVFSLYREKGASSRALVFRYSKHTQRKRGDMKFSPIYSVIYMLYSFTGNFLSTHLSHWNFHENANLEREREERRGERWLNRGKMCNNNISVTKDFLLFLVMKNRMMVSNSEGENKEEIVKEKRGRMNLFPRFI